VNESVPLNPLPSTARYDRELVRSCTILTALVIVAIPIATLARAHWFGSPNWFATSVAAAVCWLGATVSLVIAFRARRRGAVITGLLVSMLVRMAIPLGIATLSVFSRSALAEGGLLGQLLIFYLLTLTVETLLSVSLVKSVSDGAKECSRRA
jgi:hypothetical protein